MKHKFCFERKADIKVMAAGKFCQIKHNAPCETHMKKAFYCLIALSFSGLCSASEDLGPGTYLCDIRITSSHTETQLLPKAAFVEDNGSNYSVKMLGNEVASPELESVMGGIKQQATINGITFVRRPHYDDRFIIENAHSGFFYKMRNCKKG